MATFSCWPPWLASRKVASNSTTTRYVKMERRVMRPTFPSHPVQHPGSTKIPEEIGRRVLYSHNGVRASVISKKGHQDR